MHKIFKREPFVLNGSRYPIAGVETVQFSGGLTYQDGGVEKSAWIGGYYGEGRKGDPAAPWANRWQAVDGFNLKQFAKSITSSVFVLNVEHYGADSVGRIVDIVERIREVRPDVAIGLWSVLPSSQWWVVYDYAAYIDWKAGKPHINMPSTWWEHPTIGPTRIRAFEKWRQENSFMAKKLVPHLDFLCPSVYPAQEAQANTPLWCMAREPDLMIEECRRLCDLPVIPCYYPYISGYKRAASDDLNKTIMQACRKADGAIVWSDGNATQAQVESAIRSFN